MHCFNSVIAAACSATFFAATTFGGLSPKKIISTTDPDPVHVSSALTGNFTTPQWDDHGNIYLFHYTYTTPVGPNLTYLRLNADTNIPHVLFRANQLPGSSKDIYGIPLRFSVNASGDAFVQASMGPASGVDLEVGYWKINSDGSTTFIIKATDIPASALSQVGVGLYPSLNDAGTMVLGGASNTYILKNKGGAISLLANYNTPVPGVPGATFATAQQPMINAAGQVSLAASFEISPSINQTGIFLYDDAGAGINIARNTQAVPGHTGATFNTTYAPAINQAGQVIFGALTSYAGVGSKSTLWRYTSGAYAPLAVAGQSPQNRPDIALGSFHSQRSLINANGNATFLSAITGGSVTAASDMGLFFTDGNLLSLIFREGDQAPEMPEGVRFGELQGLQSFSMNQQDQVVFAVMLTGTGVDSTNNVAYYARDPDTGLHLIARMGGTLVIDGVTYPMQQINAIFFSGASDSRNTSLDDAGRFAFMGHNGTQRTIFSVVIPEPATISLLGLALITLRRRR